jgi:hypothetical protein
VSLCKWDSQTLEAIAANEDDEFTEEEVTEAEAELERREYDASDPIVYDRGDAGGRW